MKKLKDITDDEIMELAIVFALHKAPRKEDGLTISSESFQKTKKTFLICAKYFRDEYEEGYNTGKFVEASN